MSSGSPPVKVRDNCLAIVPTTGDMQGTGHLVLFGQLNELFSV